MMRAIDLETRIMAREKYFHRSDKEIPKEEHQHGINYVRAWENTVGHLSEKYEGFIENRMMDHPKVQKEFLDVLLKNISEETRSLYRKKGNEVADIPEKDDARIRQGDYMPNESYLKELITENQGDLTPEKYLKAINQWESQRKNILDSAKSEYISEDPRELKSIFDTYLEEEAHQYVNWDLALRRKEHAVGLMKIVENKRKIIERNSTGQDPNYDITEDELVVKLRDVWDKEYIIRDEQTLKERGLEHPKAKKSSYQQMQQYDKAA